MPYDPQIHHRRSIRLKDYDYSQAGAYYFTIVAQNRACLFGSIVNTEMVLNDAGEMIWKQWHALPERFTNIELDEFVVMPNHIHGILLITDNTRGGAGLSSPSDTIIPIGQTRRGDGLSSPSGTDTPIPTGQAQGTAPTNAAHDPAVGNILGAWKSILTTEYIHGVLQHHWEPFDRKLLQRDYWEHIIQNERELDAIREYIINNPANWDTDDQNPKNLKP